MSTKPRYSYAPLSSLRHTRLLILHSSETDNYPINCNIVEVNIDAGPRYEALSYTWNNEVPSKPLEIISTDGLDTQSLLITTNCARALRILRKGMDKRKTGNIGLWVDAVSINQSCNEEKAAQVSMMAEIYRKARNVVVWLGNSYAPPNRRSMLPLHLMHPFGFIQQGARLRTRTGRWMNKVCSATAPVVTRLVEKGRLRNPLWTSFTQICAGLSPFPSVSSDLTCPVNRQCPLAVAFQRSLLESSLDTTRVSPSLHKDIVSQL